MTRKRGLSFNLKIFEDSRLDMEIKKQDIKALPDIVKKYLGKK